MSSIQKPSKDQNLEQIFKACVTLAKKLNKDDLSLNREKSISDLEKCLQLFFEIYKRKDQADIKTIDKIIDYCFQEPLAHTLLTSPKDFIEPLENKVTILLHEGE